MCGSHCTTHDNAIGYRAYSSLETLLLTATKEEELDSAALYVVKLYEGEFDADLLTSQLKTFGVDWRASCSSSSCVSPTFADILSYAVALSPAQVLLGEVRELAKATYRGAAPPFDACAPSFDFCAPSFKCPLKSSATLRKDGPLPSAGFGPAPRPA